VNRRLSAARAFLTWAVAEELLSGDVLAALAVRGVKVPLVLPQLLSPEEFEGMCCACDTTTVAGARNLALLLVLRATGGRVSEVVGLCIENVQFPRHADEAGKATVMGKGGDERLVYFDHQTAGALRHYLALRGFPKTGRLFELSDQRVRQLVTELGAVVGRPDVHPHLFRHQLLTELLDDPNGGDIDAVRRIAGHKRCETTQRYTAQATARLEGLYLRRRGEKPATRPAAVSVPV
jgi:integrase/recombinase XerD